MRFARKMPAADKGLSAQLIGAGWKSMKEPKSLAAAMLTSLPFMAVNLTLSSLIVLPFNNVFSAFFTSMGSGSFSFTFKPFYVLYVYLFVVLHELLHLVFVPNFIKSPHTVVGLTLWGGFVSTTEKMTKRRYILISLAPFVLLSLVLPVILGIFKVLSDFFVFLILLNAASSCVDVLSAYLIAVQVPNKSTMVSNGFETFYK